MIVLSNAGPLIALSKLNRLSLLSELYGTVLVPRTVQEEVVSAQGRPDAVTARLFLQHYRWSILAASAEVLTEYRPPVALDAGERIAGLVDASHGTYSPRAVRRPLEAPGWAPFALLAEQPISGKLEKRVESVA